MKNKLISNTSNFLSIACAIHCGLTPIILAFSPILASYIPHNHLVEILIVGFGFVWGGLVNFHGYRKHHHNPIPLISIGIGSLFVLVGFVFIPHELQFISTIAGVIFLIAAHVHNRRLTKKCNCYH